MVADSNEWLYCPRERAPCTHYIRGWVRYRTVLDTSEKRNISCPCCESNHGPLVVPLFITLTTVSLLHTHIYVLRTIIVRYIYTHTYTYIHTIWVLHSVFHIKGMTWTEGVKEQGAEEHTWT